jgi:hypothetical protein
MKTVVIDTPDGKRDIEMKIKDQQMTFKQCTCNINMKYNILYLK